MQEQIRPLEIAFMGHNLEIAKLFLRQFAEDNEEQVAHERSGRLTLKDGTMIEAISPAMVRAGLAGTTYDQLILADDARGMLEVDAALEIEAVRWGAMCRSCVPEGFQILRYNADAPAPPKHSVSVRVEGLKEFAEAVAAAGNSLAEVAEAFNKLSEAARRYAPEGRKWRKP